MQVQSYSMSKCLQDASKGVRFWQKVTPNFLDLPVRNASNSIWISLLAICMLHRALELHYSRRQIKSRMRWPTESKSEGVLKLPHMSFQVRQLYQACFLCVFLKEKCWYLQSCAADETEIWIPNKPSCTDIIMFVWLPAAWQDAEAYSTYV